MSFSRKVAIIDGARTPFAKAGSDLASMSAVDLGVLAFQEAVARAEIAYDQIDQVYIGNIGQPADAANIARVVALFAGTPKSVPALTVQRNCASGMEAIAQGLMAIGSGQADVVVAGGTESMSQIPLLLSDAMKDVFFGLALSKGMGPKLFSLSKLLQRPGMMKPVVAIEVGLRDPVSGLNMGETAERLARDFGISREEQDVFALKSHLKAAAAKDRLAEEMAIAYPKAKKAVQQDIGPRANQTIEALQKLKPYFDRRHGSVTVGNACPITDGAAMLVMMAEEKARAEGYPILGIVRSVAFAGCDPSRMGLGPVFSSPKALKAAGLEMKNMDLIEINEAFAAQVIACLKGFASKEFAEAQFGRSEAIGEIDPEKLNVNGGAIALGHPVGTSGARLVLTILKELKRRNKQFGLASLCIGGGQGGACVVERVA